MTRALSLLALFLSSLAWAQTANNCATPSTSCASARFTGTAASGSNAIQLNTGARVKLGSGTTDYLYSDGTGIHSGGHVTATTAVASDAASGNNAFICSNLGCRLSLGNTARYLDDNGSALVANGQFIATTSTSSPQFYTSSGGFNSGAAAGGNAFSCTNVGCRVSFGNTGRYIYDTGAVLTINSQLATTSSLTVASTVFSNTGFTAASASLSLTGGPADSATAVGTTSNASNSLTTLGARLWSVRNAGVEKFNIRHDGSTQYVGATTANLIACSAATAGAVQYDTTLGAIAYCNGTAWTYPMSSTAADARYLQRETYTWSSFQPLAMADASTYNFLMPYTDYATTNGPSTQRTAIRVACNAATNGSGAGSIQLAIWDATAGAEVATTSVACNGFTNTATVVTGNWTTTTNFTTGNNYVLRVKSTSNCTGSGGTYPSTLSCTSTIEGRR